jgi:hypothetical protein
MRRVDLRDQPVPVGVQPHVHHRDNRGQADRPAEIAGQIVETGGVPHLVLRQVVLRQGPERDHIGRQIAADQSQAPEQLRHEQLPEAGLIGQRGGQIHREGKQAEAQRQHQAQIEPARDARSKRRHHHGDQTGNDDRQADLQRVLAPLLRQK